MQAILSEQKNINLRGWGLATHLLNPFPYHFSLLRRIMECLNKVTSCHSYLTDWSIFPSTWNSQAVIRWQCLCNWRGKRYLYNFHIQSCPEEPLCGFFWVFLNGEASSSTCTLDPKKAQLVLCSLSNIQVSSFSCNYLCGVITTVQLSSSFSAFYLSHIASRRPPLSDRLFASAGFWPLQRI